jgi:hypothetical protein
MKRAFKGSLNRLSKFSGAVFTADGVSIQLAIVSRSVPIALKTVEESVADTSHKEHAPDPNKWMLDSGCSAHMTPHRSGFHKYTPHRLPIHSATGEV